MQRYLVNYVKATKWLFMLVGVFCLSNLAYAVNKPIVYIVATGGTIAGVSTSQTATIYKAGSLTAEQLIASVPGIDKYAEIKYIQLYNKDSGNIMLSDWLMLNKEVNKLLAQANVSGVVITHGTDTLEETAYFLDLTVKSAKPVVMVGSMRAATALSPDGPLNLYNAVAVAADPKSIGRGVMVAMNEDIWDARDVTKVNTTSVQTFVSLNTGKIGTVFMGHVKFYFDSLERKHTNNTPFNVVNSTTLPEVAIIYQYVGVSTEMLFNILRDKKLKGIVLAGVGDGNIPSYEDKFIKQAIKQGIVVVRASRVPSGDNTDDYNNLDSIYGTITADNLNPAKARILLMLALTITSNAKTINQFFNTY